MIPPWYSLPSIRPYQRTRAPSPCATQTEDSSTRPGPFIKKLEAVGMTQSMSRVAKCIDKGPIEGFWGILKRERYYGKRFGSREELVLMIESYIDCYNNERYQRRLGVLTPMEKHNSYLRSI